MSGKKLYQPPDDKEIKEYARRVCQNIAETDNNSDLYKPVIIHGLAKALKFSAIWAAKRLNVRLQED